MKWRAASVHSWTWSFCTALVSAACLAAPAAAQLARVQPSQNAPKLLVVPFGRAEAADSDLAMEISDGLRDRMRTAYGDVFNTVNKAAICANLTESGFPCASGLEPSVIGQLARFMNARYLIDGMIFRRGTDSLLILARLQEAFGTSRISSTASVLLPRSQVRSSMGPDLANRLADNFRSFEYVTSCRNQRDQHLYQRAIDAANRALRYDPHSGGAFLCMGLTLQDQGAGTDSVQGILERAHDADSLNTVVARQLARIYEEKHDTTQLLHMLHHILQVDINDNDLRISTARVQVIRGHPDSAVMLLDSALNRNPNQFDLLNAKSIALATWEKWPDAAATLAQAFELDSTKIDSASIERIIALYDRAHDSTRSFEWVRHATQRLPAWSSNWYRYATGRLARADTNGAMEAVKQFMTLAPNDGRGHLVYATLLLAKGQPDSALVHAKMAGDADPAYRPNAATIFLRVGVAALQAQSFPRADSLLSLAKAWAGASLIPTATFYLGAAEFQRGFQDVQKAQAAQGPSRTDPAQRDIGCNAVKTAGDFLNAAEPNVTAGAAVNREYANQLLTYIPTLRSDLPKLSRVLKCPS